MKIQRISLELRLQRINAGGVGDPDFIISAIQSLAQTPLCMYLRDFPAEIQKLERILRLTGVETKKITYGKAAGKLYELYHYDNSPHSEMKLQVYEAVMILALPLRKYDEEKRKLYG